MAACVLWEKRWGMWEAPHPTFVQSLCTPRSASLPATNNFPLLFTLSQSDPNFRTAACDKSEETAEKRRLGQTKVSAPSLPRTSQQPAQKAFHHAPLKK
jgi:hypothetical protein